MNNLGGFLVSLTSKPKQIIKIKKTCKNIDYQISPNHLLSYMVFKYQSSLVGFKPNLAKVFLMIATTFLNLELVPNEKYWRVVKADSVFVS